MSYVIERCATSSTTPSSTSTSHRGGADAPRRGIARVVAKDATTDAVVGWCAFWMKDGGATAFVSGLEVRAAHRRRGVASALVRRVERECAALGASRCALSVNKTNRVAMATYERLGYVVDDEARGAMAWVMDPLVLVQHRMSKPIGRGTNAREVDAREARAGR